MRILSIALTSLLLLAACSNPGKYDSLRQALNEFTDGRDADIGIAVIIDGKDTVAVNGNRDYPMLSVYKFPIAMALGEHYRQNGLPLDFPIAILPEDLHPDTYSPMTEKILASGEVFTDTLMMPAQELLGYMIRQSDNNASDIVLNGLTGPEYVERYLRHIGIDGVNVKNSEDDMHRDTSLCYANSTTPIAMARLIDKFDREFNDSISLAIKGLMESCGTGTERLTKPLMSTNAVIGHKTGTGFLLPDGRLMAVNDAGYVHLADGHRYSIAVFVSNSGYDMDSTEALIAGISEIVFKNIK